MTPRRSVHSALHRHLEGWREAAGLSPRELAARVGVTVTTVLNWEAGASSMTLDALDDVARSYGVDPRLLLAAPPRWASKPLEDWPQSYYRDGPRAPQRVTDVWTPAKDAELECLNELSAEAAAQRLGVSPYSVRKRRRDLNLNPAQVYTLPTPEKDAELTRRWQAGEHHRAIAEHLQIARSTLFRWKNRLGLPSRAHD